MGSYFVADAAPTKMTTTSTKEFSVPDHIWLLLSIKCYFMRICVCVYAFDDCVQIMRRQPFVTNCPLLFVHLFVCKGCSSYNLWAHTDDGVFFLIFIFFFTFSPFLFWVHSSFCDLLKRYGLSDKLFTTSPSSLATITNAMAPNEKKNVDSTKKKSRENTSKKRFKMHDAMNSRSMKNKPKILP